MKKRHKHNYPGVKENYDNTLVDQTIKEIGCKAYPMKTKNDTEFCKTKVKYKNYQKKLKPWEHPPPRMGFTSMSKKHAETDYDSHPNQKQQEGLSSMLIAVRFTDSLFREVIFRHTQLNPWLAILEVILVSFRFKYI